MFVDEWWLNKWTHKEIYFNLPNIDLTRQGCQMKISIKSQTMQKRGQKKGQTDCLKVRKKPNFICSIAIPLSQKTSKLQEYQNFFFEIKIKSCLSLYWNTDLPWLFMVREIAHFGKMVPQFAYLSIGSFLYESLSYSLLYLRSES